MKKQLKPSNIVNPTAITLSWLLPVAILIQSMDTQAGKGGKGNPGGGGDDGGDSTSSGPCAGFVWFAGASLLNDDWGEGNPEDPTYSGTPYCNDKKAKIQVGFSPDGHFLLDTNNSNKASLGRDLYIEFDRFIDVYDMDGNAIMDPNDSALQLSISNTDQLLEKGIEHDINLQVGAFQTAFDMFGMPVGESGAISEKC